MPSDTFLSRLPYFLVYPSHPEKFTEVIFGQFSSTLMSPIYVYWLCKCQPLLKILRIFLRKILGTRCGLVRQKQKNVPLGIVLPCKRSPSELRSIFSISLMLLRSVGRVKGPSQPSKLALPSLMSLITMPGKVPMK